ncbi:MAG: F0F1 ATP synthase subunit epsilon [Bacteroidales bacterium]|nr:F0F1 ATP synthase subunit epsilon [Bacteroidales bacterium]
MNVRIIKPDETLYEGSAKLLQLPGTNGLFEIMEHHAPIISALKKGVLRMVLNDGSEKTYDIRGGVIKGQQDDILIMVQ